MRRRPYDSAPYRDPVRPGHRVEVEIDVMPQATSIPGRTGRVPHGIQRVIVHHEDMPALEAKVEDRMDMWTHAEAMVARKRRQWVQAKIGKAVDVPEDEALWTEGMHKLAERYTEITIPGAFRELTGRDRKALRSLTIVRERVDPEVSYEAQVAADTARLLQGSSDMGRLEQLVREQADVIAQLKAELDRKPSGNRKS
jgi:hypothetical protein